MSQDTVRVIRVIEIVGPREWVEVTLAHSFVDGEKASDVLGAGRLMHELVRTAPEPWLPPTEGEGQVPRG